MKLIEGSKRPQRHINAGHRCVKCCAGVLLVVSILALTGPRHTHALDITGLLVPDISSNWYAGRSELFSGAQATENALSGYAGFTVALTDDLVAEGILLRVTAGTGAYNYTSQGGLRLGMFAANTGFVDALVGYQWRLGRVTAKLFAGAAYEEHDINPSDPDNELAGAHLGVRLLGETWIDVTPWLWLSLDASYATHTQAYSGWLKSGIRTGAHLSLGTEFAAFGNDGYDAMRAGAFVRWNEERSEFTVSAGVSGDYEDPSSAYGALSILQKF